MNEGIFSERIKETREKQGLTLFEVAERSGLLKDTVYNIERNKRLVNLYTAIALAKALNVSLDWLCGLESP